MSQGTEGQQREPIWPSVNSFFAFPLCLQTPKYTQISKQMHTRWFTSLKIHFSLLSSSLIELDGKRRRAIFPTFGRYQFAQPRFENLQHNESEKYTPYRRIDNFTMRNLQRIHINQLKGTNIKLVHVLNISSAIGEQKTLATVSSSPVDKLCIIHDGISRWKSILYICFM